LAPVSFSWVATVVLYAVACRKPTTAAVLLCCSHSLRASLILAVAADAAWKSQNQEHLKRSVLPCCLHLASEVPVPWLVVMDTHVVSQMQKIAFALLYWLVWVVEEHEHMMMQVRVHVVCCRQIQKIAAAQVCCLGWQTSLYRLLEEVVHTHVVFQRQTIAVALWCYLGLGAHVALVALVALNKHCRLAWKWTADPAAARDLPSHLLRLSGGVPFL
jgi:hypothetical protein